MATSLAYAYELSALTAKDLGEMGDRSRMQWFLVAPATDKQLESLTCNYRPLSNLKFLSKMV
ncbi:hypothetical protein QT971_24405 [Microcoleus sp. herbarium19]|uniref:hypothetical protein n=1 Tax=unclassified Microcoleus TaxID=2642155 RepID=UPI002FD086CD